MNRCPWHNLENSPLYMEYHDKEWGVPSYEDGYLFEMFVLESFHCGLSWLLILKKREFFREAFDQFSPKRIANYGEDKVEALLQNKEIVRNKAKIRATIDNARAFLKVQEEFGTFSDYIWGFTDHKVVYHPFDGVTTHNELSDKIAKDLKKRGFKFMGTVTCYSYLEAIGIMNNHAVECDLYPNKQG
ncbi:MAG: DNA-3-methyladenine glycosylase I [Eubacteriales bacterium]